MAALGIGIFCCAIAGVPFPTVANKECEILFQSCMDDLANHEWEKVTSSLSESLKQKPAFSRNLQDSMPLYMADHVKHYETFAWRKRLFRDEYSCLKAPQRNLNKVWVYSEVRFVKEEGKWKIDELMYYFR